MTKRSEVQRLTFPIVRENAHSPYPRMMDVISPPGMKLLALVGLLAASVLLCAHMFLGESQIYSVLEIVSPNREINKINTYCRGDFAEVTPNQHDRDVCTDKAKKKKYIWIMLDAWASFQTGLLVSTFNESSYYHVLNTGYPQVITKLVCSDTRHTVRGQTEPQLCGWVPQ